ncbi:MAG: hypothetical protein IKS54_09510 [Erysipelotrichaceae bacterium]|nr:hypothetical protein [Erysipelotrichaceae bacterium]
MAYKKTSITKHLLLILTLFILFGCSLKGEKGKWMIVKSTEEFFEDTYVYKYSYEFSRDGKLTMEEEKRDDGNSIRKEYVYDKKGNVVATTIFKDGKKDEIVTCEYDKSERKTREIFCNASEEPQRSIEYFYFSCDDPELIIERKYPLGFVSYKESIEYDDKGTPIKQAIKYYNEDGSLKEKTMEAKIEYDKKGNIVRNKQSKTDKYYENGKLLKSDSYEYSYKAEYDSRNKILSKTENLYNDDVIVDWEYEYDKNGNLIKESRYPHASDDIFHGSYEYKLFEEAKYKPIIHLPIFV